MGKIRNFPHIAKEEDVTHDGKTVRVVIIPADEHGKFIIEIVDEYGTSTVFDELLDSAEEAMALAKAAIDEEGIDEFISDSSYDIVEDIPTVNRCSIVIRYKQSFIDWINSHDEDDVITLADSFAQPRVYLADEVDSDFEPDPHRLIRALSDEIFESELNQWYVDESLWPEDRSWKAFQDYFEYDVCWIVYDLGAVPIEQEP